ncbi:MAG: hypothetical protein FJ087_03470 [Deltaproteobacteria bacterium]|nr:hypothetical protein [Deltaproteobacteria bacterium]
MRTRLGLAWAVVAVAALAVAATGCKKKDGEPGKAGAAAAAAPKADVGSVRFPDNVLAFGGVKSLDDTTTAIAGLVAKFQPQMAPMVSAQIPALLQGQVLGVKNMTWLDSKKPIRFAFLDYKQFADPIVLAFPHKGKDQVTAALPDNKAAGAPDNETKFSSPMGQELYVNFAGDFVVFTMAPKAFAAVKDFVGGDLAKYDLTELADVQVSARNLDRIAGPEIEAAQKRLVEQAAAPSPIPLPGMQKLLQDEVAMLLDVFRQTEVGRLVLRYDGDNLVLRAGLKVVEGKGLAKFAGATKDRKLELYKTLPAGGWLIAASNVDPTLFEGWSKLGIDFWADLLKLDPTEKAKIEGLMKAAMEQQTGDSAFYVGRQADFPLSIVTIAGVKDGAKARDVTLDTYAFLFSKLGTLVEQYAGPTAGSLPKLDWTSFKAFADGLKPVLAETGVTIGIRAEDVAGVKVDAVELAVDYSKLPVGADPQVQSVAKVVGNKLSLAVGFGKDKMYAVLGRDAVADIGKVSREAGGGGQLAASIQQYGAGTNPAIAAYLSFVDLMKLIALFDDTVTRQMPAIATASSDIGFTFIAGGHGDRIIDAVVAVPVTKIAALVPKPGMGPAPVAPAPGGAPIAPTP